MGSAARTIAIAFAGALAGGLMVLAVRRPGGELPGPAAAREEAGGASWDAVAALDGLCGQAERNSRALEELEAGIQELKDLLARATAASAKPEDPADGEGAGRGDGAAAPQTAATLPPSRHPFLDYETLPEAYLPHVGEDELFYLLDDGRLARLSFPGSDVSPRRDLETRTRAEELMRLQVEQKAMTEAWTAEALARGNYAAFDTPEAAQEHIRSRRSSKSRLGMQAIPGGKGYAVLDLTPLHQSDAFRGAEERRRALMKELGIRSVRVFWVDPPSEGSQPPEHHRR